MNMNYITLLSIILCLSISWLLGSFWLWAFKIPVKKELLHDSFIRTLIGLYTIIVVYANYITRFNTVLNGLLIIAILFLFLNRKQKTANRSIAAIFSMTGIKSLAITMLIGTLFFLLQGFFFYGSAINNMPHNDTLIYSHFIDFLTYSKVESFQSSLYTIVKGVNSPVPYHYLELWLSALISRHFNILSVEAYTVATHSIFATILVLGLATISRIISKSMFLKIFAGLSIFLYGIMMFDILPQTSSFQLANGWHPKLLTIAILYVWLVILLIENNKYFYFPLLLLPIVSITTSPAVIPTLISIAVLGIFKKWSFVKQKPILLGTLITCSFLFLFYTLNSGSSSTGFFKLDTILYGISIDKLRPFKIISGTIAIFFSLYIIYFIPAIILIAKPNLREKYIDTLRPMVLPSVIYALLFTFGLVLWALTSIIHDSVQFFYINAIVFLNVLIFLLLALIYKALKHTNKIYSYAITLFIVSLLIYNIAPLRKTLYYKMYKHSQLYSEEYIMALQKKFNEFEKNDCKLVAYINNEKALRNYWVAFPTSLGTHNLALFTNNFYVANLNCFSVPLEYFDNITKYRLEAMIKSTDFYKFGQSKGVNLNEKDQIAQLQFDYVKEKNIKIVFLEADTELPKPFYDMVDTTIADMKSGQKFVFLKK